MCLAHVWSMCASLSFTVVYLSASPLSLPSTLFLFVPLQFFQPSPLLFHPQCTGSEPGSGPGPAALFCTDGCRTAPSPLASPTGFFYIPPLECVARVSKPECEETIFIVCAKEVPLTFSALQHYHPPTILCKPRHLSHNLNVSTHACHQRKIHSHDQ